MKTEISRSPRPQREQSAHPPRPKSAAAPPSPRRHQTHRTTTRVGARLFDLILCLQNHRQCNRKEKKANQFDLQFHNLCKTLGTAIEKRRRQISLISNLTSETPSSCTTSIWL